MDHNPFRSARLFYRAIESPQDDEFFHSLQRDPFSYASSTPSLLAPASNAYTNKIRDHFQGALLGVIICLPTNPENLSLAGDSIGPDVKTTSPSLIRNEPYDKGIPIGSLSLERPGNPRLAHHRFADIGIDIAPKYQSRGYGKEAIEWATEWGFTHGNLHRIGIRVLGWNHRAYNLYKHIGFIEESRQREQWWHNGKWWDDIGLAILEHEWRNIKAKESAGNPVIPATEETLL
jgi:ribosomal protein S18 acetylase RimI-like enzyme